MNLVIIFFSLLLQALGSKCSEYQFKPETGSFYKHHMKGLTWMEAYMTCEAEGGHLAIINNQVEANVIRDILTKTKKSSISDAYCPDYVYIGFFKFQKYGNVFKTIHGESLDSSLKWAPGEPNNGSNMAVNHPPENCGSLIWDTMELNDNWCDCKASFICEKKNQTSASQARPPRDP